LEVLNYDMTDIFMSMGINTEGGEFLFAEIKDINEVQAKINILAQLRTTFNLPISDDYLYEISSTEKPENYKELKEQAQAAEEPTALPAATKEDLKDEPENAMIILKDIVPKHYWNNEYWAKNYGKPNPMRHLGKFVYAEKEFKQKKEFFTCGDIPNSDLNDIRKFIMENKKVDSLKKLNYQIHDLTGIIVEEQKSQDNFFNRLFNFFVQARRDRAALDW
jgi:hypothetical protein